MSSLETESPADVCLLQAFELEAVVASLQVRKGAAEHRDQRRWINQTVTQLAGSYGWYLETARRLGGGVDYSAGDRVLAIQREGVARGGAEALREMAGRLVAGDGDAADALRRSARRDWAGWVDEREETLKVLIREIAIAKKEWGNKAHFKVEVALKNEIKSLIRIRERVKFPDV